MSRARRLCLAAVPALLAFAVLALPARAQNSKFTVDDDCTSYAFFPDGTRIVYSARRFGKAKVLVRGKKKRVSVERDDIWEVDFKGKTRRLVDGRKFIKSATPISYAIQSIRVSPGGRRLAVQMTTRTVSPRGEETGAVRSGELTALLQADGKEINIAGTKSGMMRGALNAAWLADGQTVVYMKEASGSLLYTLAYIRPISGVGGAMLSGHDYAAVAWNPAHNVAAAIERNPSLNGPIRLVWINLIHHTERTLAVLHSFTGHLTVSPSATEIAYYHDGNTIDIRPVAHPDTVTHFKVPYGRYEWAPGGKYLLLKPGPDTQSNLLIEVSLPSGQYHDVYHALLYHNFHISPDGRWVALTEPGMKMLKLYPAPWAP